MNRRHFCRFFAGLSMISGVCRSQLGDLRDQVQKLGEEFVILGLGLSITDVRGKFKGRLCLPDGCWSAPVIAPDAGCIAWIAARNINPIRNDGPSRIFVWNEGGEPKELVYPTLTLTDIAISGDAERIAVLAQQRLGHNPQMLVFDSRSNRVVADLSRFSGLAGTAIERLQLSLDASLLAIGSRDTVALVHLASGQNVLHASGRFPAISPNGDRLAYVKQRSLDR